MPRRNRAPLFDTPEVLQEQAEAQPESDAQRRLKQLITDETQQLWDDITGGKPPIKKIEKWFYQLLARIITGFYGVDNRIRMMNKSVTAAGALANRVFNTGQALLRFYEKRELARYKEMERLIKVLKTFRKEPGTNEFLDALDLTAFGYPDRQAFIDDVLAAGEELFREAKGEAPMQLNAEDQLSLYIGKLIKENQERVNKNLFSNIDEQTMMAVIDHMTREGATPEEICEKFKLSDVQYSALKEMLDAQKTSRQEVDQDRHTGQPEEIEDADTIVDGPIAESDG